MADAKMLKKVPVREQDPKVRATNFEEVCLGYNQEEAMEEAQRCLGCKKPKCVEGCPVSINIPGFIEEIKEGKIEEAYKVIGLSSALPAICGRVCPQESQCEGKCIRGVKGEAVSHTIVSMNPIMVDGTGMCGACRLQVGDEIKFACVDGPEFDGHLVDFDQAMKRSQMYKTEEGRALLKLQEGDTHHGGCGHCGGDK